MKLVGEKLEDSEGAAAERAIEELETLRRRTRRRVIAAGVAAQILLGLAFFIGRRPRQAPAPPPVEDAITQWRRAVELDPANTAAWKNIEMAQHRMGH